MKKLFILISLFVALNAARGQDSVSVLTEDNFIRIVLRYHPVARQADLIADRGDFGVKKARGGFDPYLYTSFDQKQFDDKDYFSILGSGLKVPTWFGLDLKFGYDRNQGVFLNPERNVPDNGLLHAGISLPIGEGLFIDERRKVLQQAKIFSDFTTAEQNRVLNDLLLESLKTYWYWVKFYQQYQVFQQAVEVAQERFIAIRESYLMGDKPAVDTLEAYIQVQNRQISENQAMIDYRNASLDLSNFLWFDNNVPLEISELMRPPSREEMDIIQNIADSELQETLLGIEETHPELQMYQYKLADLSVEERWKKEKIKPKLNVNYNFLNESFGTSGETTSMNNYKWGLQFSMPLFLRSEVGDLRLTQIKLKEAEYGQSQKTLEVTNKILMYYQQLENLLDQRELYIENVNNYTRLLNAERRKFDAGESSLFLINSREVSLIEANIKWLEVEAKTRISQKSYYWAAGLLFTGVNDENF